MALTEDQSAALQTTIGNLNKSIKVNKEVLDIVRSVGNPSLSEYFSVSHYRISINGKIRHRAP